MNGSDACHDRAAGPRRLPGEARDELALRRRSNVDDAIVAGTAAGSSIMRRSVSCRCSPMFLSMRVVDDISRDSTIGALVVAGSEIGVGADRHRRDECGPVREALDQRRAAARALPDPARRAPGWRGPAAALRRPRSRSRHRRKSRGEIDRRWRRRAAREWRILIWSSAVDDRLRRRGRRMFAAIGRSRRSTQSGSKAVANFGGRRAASRRRFRPARSARSP